MFTKLTDTSKAAIFTVLVLFLSVGARNPGMEELLAVIDETEGLVRTGGLALYSPECVEGKFSEVRRSS
jgi:hypothetical protein